MFDYPASSAMEARMRTRPTTEANANARDLVTLARGAPEFVAEGTRFLRGRERAPCLSAFRILAVIEQRPTPASALLLSDEVDPLGIRRERVDWHLGERERASIETATAVLDGELRHTDAGVLDVEPWLMDRERRADHAFDSFHPAGGARIGYAVDNGLQVRRSTGVYVCGAAAFPRSGCVSLTLTVVALALRLADHLRG